MNMNFSTGEELPVDLLAATEELYTDAAQDLIRVMTGGGPINATNVLIYRLYEVGFGTNSSIGRASVIGLILFVIMLVVTILQLRYLERLVSYAQPLCHSAPNPSSSSRSATWAWLP